MKTQIEICTYNGQEIEFDLTDKNVMVNATEMAKIFGKEVKHFNENDSTKNFIQACLNSRNSDYLNVKEESDLIVSKQKSGTWMHRVLALKFAAWLSADFEVWVYQTIEQLLFHHARLVEETNRERALLQNEIHRLHSKLTLESEDYRRLKLLEQKEHSQSRLLSKTNSGQIKIFREKLNDE